MISVGGLPFRIDASVPLSSGENGLLERIRQLPVQAITDEPVVLRLVDRPSWSPTAAERGTAGGPAALHFASEVIRVAHAEVIGEFDLVSRSGTYARFNDSPAALRIMLRTAFSACLPFHGGIPLHSAGLARGGKAYLFFGESGAGKSTIASVAGLQVISDEIVAVTVERGTVLARTTGFGDEIDSGSPPLDAVPVDALVQLAKGKQFEVVALSHACAVQQLLKVILAPPHQRVWTRALSVVDAVVRSGVPVLRMAWSGGGTPFPALDEWLVRQRAFRP